MHHFSRKSILEYLTRSAGSMALAISVPLSAGASSFVSPDAWTRGDSLSTFQHWDNFEERVDATPDVADANPNGTATLTELSGISFVTSTANIYGFSAPTAFDIRVPIADIAQPEPYDLTLILQVGTFGNPIDTLSPRVNGVEAVDFAQLQAGIIEQESTERSDQTWYLFNLPYADYADGLEPTTELIVTFNASSTSMSLDQVLIDTALQPASLGFFDVTNPVTGSGVPGDFNGSGSVEQGDLNLVLNGWGGPRGDWANVGGLGSLTVDQEELNEVLNNWGSGSAPDLRSNALPEPMAAALLTFGVVLAHRRVNPTTHREAK